MKKESNLKRQINLLALACALIVTEAVIAAEPPFVSGVYHFPEPVTQDTFSVFADLEIGTYPPGTAHNPVFEASLVEPLRTDKIRLVINDPSAHVTELRLFGPETNEYPPALSGKTAGIEAPNLATDASVEASSGYEGRPKEAVIDGLMTFASRWYSGSGKAPHWLVIDMGEERIVDHIQMVSGYHAQGSAAWSAIVKDFHFEYWNNGDWKKMLLVEPPTQEAGSIGLKIEEKTGGNLVFLHNNDSAKRFAIGSFQGGKLEIIESYSPENIEEPLKGGKLRIELKKSGSFFHLFCNGRKVATYDMGPLSEQFRGPLTVSLIPLSQNTTFTVTNSEVEGITKSEDAFLRNIVIKDLQNNEVIWSNFDPFDSKIYAILPRVTNEVSIELLTTEPQQSIINGQNIDSLHLDKSQIDQAEPMEIRIVSTNGERNYILEIVPVPPAGKLRLAYAEAFEADELNSKDWIYRRGLRWQSLNTPEAVSVGDGKLRIKLSVEDGQQKVGGIISQNVYGYGYYETRAKLTDVKGWHSAFWLYGLSENLPKKGSQSLVTNGVYTEIDCFESITADAFTTNLHHTVHGLKGKEKMHQAHVADQYHTFAWLWTPEEVCYYFDAKLIDRRVLLPPTRPQNVWLTCVAHPDAEAEELPQEILFDYFHYYEFADQPDKLPENAIIVSTQSAGYSEIGKWETAEKDKAQSYLLETNTRKTNTKGSSCEWTTQLPAFDQYEVFVWNPYIVIDPVINERVFEIQTADGLESAFYNPRISGQKWISLGTFVFKKEASVLLRVLRDEVYRADAVAFVPRG